MTTIAPMPTGPERMGNDAVVYEAREGIDLADAITWANSFACLVTLYLYDEGQGTS